MKIGVFDSGLGGLILFKSILKKLPQYDYIYLGDTKRVPYGNHSHEAVFQFTKEAVDYLFKQDCQLVIIACGTASSRALRRIQQEFLPKNYPNRRVLGIIIPLAEEAVKASGIKNLGVLATSATVSSKSFVSEIEKLNKNIRILQQPAPLLVPLIEDGKISWSDNILKEYLKPFLKKKLDTLILGCTHYPLLKNKVSKIMGKNVQLISPDVIVPRKLKEYLLRHQETDSKLTKKGTRKLLATDITENMERLRKKWFGKSSHFEIVELS